MFTLDIKELINIHEALLNSTHILNSLFNSLSSRDIQQTLPACAFINDILSFSNESFSISQVRKDLLQDYRCFHLPAMAISLSNGPIVAFCISKSVARLSFFLYDVDGWFECIFNSIIAAVEYSMNHHEKEQSFKHLISACSVVLKADRTSSHPERLLKPSHLRQPCTSSDGDLVRSAASSCALVALRYFSRLWNFALHNVSNGYEIIAFTLDLCKHLSSSTNRGTSRNSMLESLQRILIENPLTFTSNPEHCSSCVKWIDIVTQLNNTSLQSQALSHFHHINLLPSLEKLELAHSNVNLSSFVEIDIVLLVLKQRILLLAINLLIYDENPTGKALFNLLSFKSLDSAERLVLLFSGNDVYLFEMLLGLLKIAKKSYAPTVLHKGLHAGVLLTKFLELIAHDSTVLLDWLLSPETCCLQYLLEVAIFLDVEKYHLPCRDKQVLCALKLKLQRLHEKELFPYNPSALVARLDRIT